MRLPSDITSASSVHPGRGFWRRLEPHPNSASTPDISSPRLTKAEPCKGGQALTASTGRNGARENLIVLQQTTSTSTSAHVHQLVICFPEI